MHRSLSPSIAALRNLRGLPDRIRTSVIGLLLICSVITSLLAAAEAVTLELDRPADYPVLEPIHALDQDLPLRLFLVRPCDRLVGTAGIIIHGAEDGAWLVSGEIAALRALTLRGCTVTPLPDVPAAPTNNAREWSWIGEPDPDIAAMVEEVQWEGVRDKIRWLVNFDTRYGFAANHRHVASSIASAFEALGLETTMHSFQYYSYPMCNIEATQTGVRYPDSYVIICGHFDSISKNPMYLAPGADDNGTGVATVLTAAEILSRHTFEYSIRYICFDAEELGLIGSRLYASLARRMHLDIVGVLNFDMMGYWKEGVEKDLEIEANHASAWLAEAVVNAAQLYTDTPYELHIYDDAWWGDHWQFWRAGYAAVNHEEAWDWYDPDFNPYYHSTQDRIEYVDPGFTVGNIRVGVAALATLAGYVPTRAVAFDIRPGSRPNPFNPKSRGVVPALLVGSTDVDVHDIDVSSLRIGGSVSPSATRIADMGSAMIGNGHPCAGMSPDGIDDLWLKFQTEEIAAVLPAADKGATAILRITGRLSDGTRIEGEDAVVIVGDEGRAALTLAADKPSTFALYQNAPNPFNPTTIIRFDVPSAGGAVTLRIYDVNGRLVRTLVDGALTAGEKSISWDGLNDAGLPAAAGMYFYRLTAPGFVETRKMMLLK